MLILIPGATGNLGVHLVRSTLRRGHKVRGLGRSPTKLPEDLRNQLESFVEISGFDDRAKLDVGCSGVDAVICAYGSDPVLLLDGQLALLRASERAGIKRFHAASWNLDWSNMPLGTIESYDPLIAFSRQAALTSSIKPIYVFCGVLATTLFGVPGAGALEGDSAMWIHQEKQERMINVVGDGNTLTPYGVEADVADFSVAVTTGEDGEKGGYCKFCSDEFTMNELAATYRKVRQADCSVNQVMDVEACRQMLEKARAGADDAGNLREQWPNFIGLVYGLVCAEGTYNPKPVDASRYPDVPRTKIEDFVQENQWV